MKFFSSASTATAACPVCGLKSVQPLSKIRLNQTMLCPERSPHNFPKA
ncbi:YnfU family zinc-binding protein [Klebsiella oxytoca]|nr:YnfU family zinc-binding protein [Klebsiella oxytoca]MDM4292375.1 YnfU family zinc-binding protein [Klebsiella oxytoca]